jgi:gliding motility-associated-like protein
LSALPAETIFCSDVPAELNFSSSVEPVEIQWQVVSNGAVTGPVSGAGYSPVTLDDAMTNASMDLDSVLFVLTTPEYVCPAEPLEFLAYVAPVLNLSPLADLQVCAGDSALVEDFELGVEGAEYSWFTYNDEGVGLASSGDESLMGWVAMSNSNAESVQAQVVIVVEAFGCTDSTEFTTTVEPIPEVLVTNWFDEVCSGEALEASVESTVSTATVTWNAESSAGVTGSMSGSGETVQDVLVNSGNELDTVLYTFVVSGAFCPSDSVTATTAVLPSFELTEVGPLAWCDGENAIVDGYESDAIGVTYSWVNANEGIGLTAGGEGLIPSWTATNSGSSSISSEVTVFANLSNCPEESVVVDVSVHPTPQLTSNVGPNGGLDCQTGIAVIEAFSSTGFGAFEFDGIYVINENGAVAEVGAAGEYVIDFIDDATGCPAQLEVTVSEPVPAVISNQVLDSLACFGLDDATIEIDAGGGEDLLYDWFPPVSASSVAANLGPGTYQVVVTNASNCQDSSSFILEPVLPIEVELLDSGASICGASNGFIEVGASGGYGGFEYDWSGNTGPLLWAIPSGSYPVTVTDAYGCSVTATFSIDCAEDIPIGINQLLTPNGDGKNDRWILEDLYLYPNHSVKVFNRWGVLVYEAAPYLNDWAGTWEAGNGDGSVLPSASYYYFFDPGLSTAEPSRGFIEIQNEGR